MTLIADVRTADSIVVVADKRITTRAGFSDDVKKILKVGERAVACAYIGVRQEDHGGTVRYDVYKLMEEHFAGTPFSVASLGTLQGYLTDKFVQYRKSYHVTQLPTKVGNAVFKLAFFTWEDNSFRVYYRTFQMKADGSLHASGDNPKAGHGGVELLAGERFQYELSQGKNPEFATLRADPEVKKLVVNAETQPVGTLTTAQAKAFCTRLIGDCHDAAVKAKVKRITISKTVDVAVVKADGVHFE